MKTKLSLLSIAIIFSTPLFAHEQNSTNIESIKFELCNTNALHYAASINDLDYFKDLLNSGDFILTDLDKNCDSVYHIAVKNNNTDVLKELFLKIPTFDIKNIYGENLTQYAVKNQTPESLIFLINNGVNPYEKSSNDKNTFDYQEKYGNVVTETILNDFEKTMQLEKHQDQNETYSKTLAMLTAQLHVAEVELDRVVKENPENVELIETLKNQINLLNSQIESLKNIIIEKEKEIEFLKQQLLNSNINVDLINNKDDNIEEANGVITEILKRDDDILIDISNDGQALDDSMKIFEILSKPIYKTKNDND